MQPNNPFLKTIIEDPEGVAVFSIDLNYRYTFFSASYQQLIESRFNSKIAVGDNLLRSIKNSDEKKKTQDLLDRGLRGETFKAEAKYTDIESESKIYLINYRPVKNEQGKLIGLIAWMNDILPERQAILEKTDITAAYHLLIENTVDAIFVMQAEGDIGKIVSANKTAAEMHGYTHEEFINLHVKDLDIDTPEDHKKFDERLKKLLSGEKLSFEVNHRKKDGTIFPLEVTTMMMNIDGQKLTLSINRDITKRKEIDEVVKDREHFIESITTSSPDMIYVFDIASQKNAYSNRHLTHMLGFTQKEIDTMTQQSLAGLLHPEDYAMLPTTLARWDKATDNEVIETELRMKHKDGTWRWFVARDTVFKRDKNGKVIQTVGTAQDRTASKKAEIDLRQSEERFKRLQEASFGGIGIYDNDKIIDANQGLSNITGYSIEELMGMDGLSLVASEYREHIIQKIRTGYELPYDVIGLKKDGTRYHLEVHAKNIPFQNKVVRVTEFRDITERKQIEESIREQNVRLGDIADNLTSKNEQLEEFTQIVSHNLRAPVGNIVTLLSLYESANEAERTEYIHHLKNSSNLLLGTLNELNEVLKIKQSQRIEAQDLEFSMVHNNVCQMLSASISELNADIHADFSAAPKIQYPNIYLESIFLNLVSNALKYHSPTRTPQIRIKTYLKEKDLMLTIEDNGLGINLEKYRHQIFKMRKTFHEHPESRGLGLFLIKNQIESMGGEINLTSVVGKGTTFYVKLA
ncbi:hypothetical protein BH09BAC3_BH09BAC3_36490 [soil metagenome]